MQHTEWKPNTIKTQTRPKLCYGLDVVCHLKVLGWEGWSFEVLIGPKVAGTMAFGRDYRILLFPGLALMAWSLPYPTALIRMRHSQETLTWAKPTPAAFLECLCPQWHKPLFITYSACLRDVTPVIKKHPNPQTFTSSNAYNINYEEL